MSLDAHWTALGRTDNASFHLAEPHIIVIAPDEGGTDDETTARQSVAKQHEHWRAHGGRGSAIVLMDRVGHQTKGARQVYQTEVDPQLITGFALVTRSVFGRAVAAVFMGLARPVVPTRMFGSLEAALQWARAHNGERDGG
jgi:hypothetical protein